MIAIHKSDSGFHPRWVAYCEKSNIPFKMVDCLSTDLINQLSDCDALMWHHSQNNPSHLIIAKQILFAVQQAGLVVFPDFNTAWHFDDKVGQKYLLEALKIPWVKSHVFYNKTDALQWIKQTTFPKVFKLRGGAGSANVKLVHNTSQAMRIVTKAYGRGFSNYDAWSNLKEIWRKWRLGKTNGSNLLKATIRIVYKPAYSRIAGKEIGYVYFQDFITNNDHDIRVIVIGDKAFAIKRMVRKNDFRASGSGNIKYEKSNFSDEVIRMGFDIHNKLKGQCTAMDFVFEKGVPEVVEISFGFVKEVYDPCSGYWDKDLIWYEGKFEPYGWMVELVQKQIQTKNA